MIIDLLLTAILYLTPALILRFAILKKGFDGFVSFFIALILGIFSHILFLGVQFVLYGTVNTDTSMNAIPILWVIINSMILRDYNKDKKKGNKRDSRML